MAVITQDQYGDMIDHIRMLYENFLERISPADERVVQWNMSIPRERENIPLRRLREHLAFRWFQKRLEDTEETPDMWYKRTVLDKQYPEGAGINGRYGGVWNMKPFKQYTSIAELNADINKRGSGLSSAQESIKADKKLKNNREIKKRSRIYI